MASSGCVKWVAAAVLAGAGPFLAACGGGGGGGGSTMPPVQVSPPPPPPPPPGGVDPTWTAGVFPAASSLKDKCEAPRSGVDIEGNAFPDTPGTLIKEKFWLRSWTNDTYLWNTEVPDQDPATFGDRLAYFAELRTRATTASGEDKDDFHFSQSTEDYLLQRTSAPSSGYGARIIALSSSPPRDYRIQYTEPNSPASTPIGGQVPFPRGTRILTIDGVDLVNGGATQAELDTLNAGLFPATSGETHAFTVRDVDGTERAFNLTSADVAPAPVNRTSVINTGAGKVGYIMFNTFSPFSSEAQIANAMATMQSEGVTDLVLDLRYNGGGLLAVASQLSYMIAGPTRTNNKTFELLRFNAAAGNTNPVNGTANGPIPFYSTGLGFSLNNGTSLSNLNLNRVFILSTGRTCSASEAVINGLRGIDVDVVLIGDITCGKPFGFYPTDNCGETYYTIQFQGVNDKGFGDYADGFVPMNSTFNFGVRLNGCVVADDLSKELGDETEGMLAAALNYRATGACPALPSPKPSPKISYKTQGMSGVATTDLSATEDFLRNNRDMRMPE